MSIIKGLIAILLSVIGIALLVVLLVVGGTVAALIAVFGEMAIWIARIVVIILIGVALFKMIRGLF